MKKIFVLLLALAATVSASAQKNAPVMKNTADSLSYAIGVLMSDNIKQFGTQAGIELNVDLVTAAFRAATDNGTAAFDNNEAMEYLNHYFTEVLPGKAKVESAAYLASVKKGNRKVKETPSGLLYEIITPGNKERIDDDGMRVSVKYTMWTSDGTEIDSSGDEPVEFGLTQVITGFSEGVKLIGKGGKIKLWIPSDLGYGDRSMGSIGPNQALLAEVELLEFFLPEPEDYSWDDEEEEAYYDEEEYDGGCACGCGCGNDCEGDVG